MLNRKAVHILREEIGFLEIKLWIGLTKSFPTSRNFSNKVKSPVTFC